PSALPPVVDATSVPVAAPAAERPEHRQPSPAARPQLAPAPAPVPRQDEQETQEDAPPPSAPAVVAVKHEQSVREDLRTLREEIRSRVESDLERLKSLRED
ncbi:MAG: hypothetical protein H0X35_12375, partial [Pseudonocardiales bacterium]|nr:hypothetical protein [Pseudonocardiales bacterium]